MNHHHKYRMPGEFEPHHGCIIAWPVREGSWREKGRYAKEIMSRVAKEIAKSEKVYITCAPSYVEEVREYLKDADNPEILPIRSDDAWTRDIGPTFVYSTSDGTLSGVDWKFNAWGGDVDGLYEDYDMDDAYAKRFCEAIKVPIVDARPFVLEGGAIHVDGEGTAIVTKACLLSKGRNPDLSQREIEERLKHFLGVDKVIWLENGIYMDETNEHVDNILAFASPGEVVLAWCDNQEDPQYEFSRAAWDVLINETDARGRRFVIHRLPVPKIPVTVKREELQGFVYSESEEQRYAGERLAASYVNFYIANSAIIVPQFADEHDEQAVKILQKVFPDREIIPIMTRELLLGGGNIHCLTQQIPADERFKVKVSQEAAK